MTKIDLSYLYHVETVSVANFTVDVREIPHGEMIALQRKIFGDFQATKTSFEFDQQLKGKKLDVTGFADEKNLLAIQSWTLKDVGGKDVPVSLEAWHALPEWIIKQIEKGVERLNPELDESFQEEPGMESEEQG